jgi:drug/metabolite transporter (DMT)-like permease
MNAFTYMVISALGFSVMGLFVKLASLRGFPVLEIITARAGVSLVLSYWDIRRARVAPFGFNKKILFLRGFLGFLALLAVYKSLTLLPLAEATLIQYLHPLFTAILAWHFLKEPISRETILCILLAVLGLLIITQPKSLGVQSIPTAALLIALFGAAMSGAAYTTVRYLSQKEHSSVIILYFPLISLPSTIILGWKDFIMPVGSDWLILFSIGIFTQIGQIGLTRGIALEPAGKAAAISYVQIVFAAILGIIVFGETLSLSTIIGSALIVSGLIVNQLCSLKSGRLPH